MNQLYSKGFFINADGVKSTDMAVKKKSKREATEPVEELEKKANVIKKCKKIRNDIEELDFWVRHFYQVIFS